MEHTTLQLNPWNRKVKETLKDPKKLHAEVYGACPPYRDRILYYFNPEKGLLHINQKLVKTPFEEGVQKHTFENTKPFTGQIKLEGSVSPQMRSFHTGKHVVLKTPEEREAWLHRKLEGFTLENYSELCLVKQDLEKDRHRWYVQTVHVSIEGTVRDPAVFNAILEDGVGPRKAYGCGYFVSS